MFNTLSRRCRYLSRRSGRAAWRLQLVLLFSCFVFALALHGCTGWAPTDPAGALGRWKPQPTQQRILQTLSVAEEAEYEEFANAEDPTPEDLAVQIEDYVIGPGDTIDIEIFELLAPDTPYLVRVLVNDLGYVSIQHVGKVQASDLTPSQLERRIAEILHPNILRDPQINAVVIGRTQRTFSIVGAVREPYRYPIDKPDYEDFLSVSQDFSGALMP